MDHLVLVRMLIGFASKILVLVTILIGACILESGFGHNADCILHFWNLALVIMLTESCLLQGIWFGLQC